MDKIIAPCSYQGGKQRIAKEIVDYILNTTLITQNTRIYDLCCGSGAITVELLNRGVPAKNIIMCDKGSWGRFWNEIGNGEFDLNIFHKYSKSVPRDKFLVQEFMKNLSDTNANEDEAYKYILLQSAAFGSKQIWNVDGVWRNAAFRSYWQPTATSNRKSPVNPMHPSIDVLEKRIEHIVNNCKGLTCYHKDIFEMIEIISKDTSDKVIYIDPPYANTTGYGYELNIFDFLRELFNVTVGYVFVSEKQPLSDEAIRLNFLSKKGGISGNRKVQHEEWLSVFR